MPQAFVPPILCCRTISAVLLPFATEAAKTQSNKSVQMQLLHKQCSPALCSMCQICQGELHLCAWASYHPPEEAPHGCWHYTLAALMPSWRWRLACAESAFSATLMCSQTNTGNQVHIAHHSILHCKVDSMTFLCAVVYRWDCRQIVDKSAKDFSGFSTLTDGIIHKAQLSKKHRLPGDETATQVSPNPQWQLPSESSIRVPLSTW